MITFCLGAGMITYLVLESYKKEFSFLTGILFFSFVILLFPLTYQANTQRLSKEETLNEAKEVVQYLKENMEEGDIYIDEMWDYRHITLMSGIPQTNIAQLKQPEIKESIKKVGFAKTMEKYNVFYLITTRETPIYEEYLGLFDDVSLPHEPTDSLRNDLILAKLDPQRSQEPMPTKEVNLIDKYKIFDKFVLIKEIGQYKIFGFKN